MSHIENIIVNAKAASLCLAHALNIATAKVNRDPNYKSHRNGRYLKQPFHVYEAFPVLF